MLCLIKKKKTQQIKPPKRTMRWANTETVNTVAGTRFQVTGDVSAFIFFKGYSTSPKYLFVCLSHPA